MEETVERTVEQTAGSEQAPKPEPKQPPKGKDKASEQPEVVDGLVIGDTATLSNGLAMTVNGATVLTPQAPKGKAPPGGKDPPNRAQEGEVYVLVNITIANNGNEVQNIVPPNFKAFDAQGYTLRAAAPSQVPSTREWTGEFRPGQTREGTVSFVTSPDRSVTFRFEGNPGPRGSRAEWELGPVANMPVS